MNTNINPYNTESTAKMLDHINGKASAHTYTTKSIQDAIDKAYRKFQQFGIPKKDRHHFTLVSTSGDYLPKSYTYSRLIVVIKWTKAGEPRIKEIHKRETFPNMTGFAHLNCDVEYQQTLDKKLNETFAQL